MNPYGILKVEKNYDSEGDYRIGNHHITSFDESPKTRKEAENIIKTLKTDDDTYYKIREDPF